MQILLLSGAEEEKERAKDVLKNVIEHHGGEYILRIGKKPPRAVLFSPDAQDETEWTGTPRSEDEITKIRDEATRLMNELGGKVG